MAEHPTPGADAASIRRMYREWIARFREEGAAGYAAFFTEEGELWPPESAVVAGRESVRGWIEAFHRRFEIVTDRVVHREPIVSGGLAVSRYRIEGRYLAREGPAAVPYDQKYLDVLERAGDSWRIAVHSWSAAGSGHPTAS